MYILRKFKFKVPCHFEYEIKAKDEKHARELLKQRGGIDIDGELILNSDDYYNAKLIRG